MSVSPPEWQAQSLHVVVFPAEIVRSPDDSWWKTIVGGEPEQRIFETKLGRTQYVGAFLRGVLTLSITPARIDWIYAARDASEERAEEPEVLGPFDEEARNFYDAVAAWLRT